MLRVRGFFLVAIVMMGVWVPAAVFAAPPGSLDYLESLATRVRAAALLESVARQTLTPDPAQASVGARARLAQARRDLHVAVAALTAAIKADPSLSAGDMRGRDALRAGDAIAAAAGGEHDPHGEPQGARPAADWDQAIGTLLEATEQLLAELKAGRRVHFQEGAGKTQADVGGGLPRFDVGFYLRGGAIGGAVMLGLGWLIWRTAKRQERPTRHGRRFPCGGSAEIRDEAGLVRHGQMVNVSCGGAAVRLQAGAAGALRKDSHVTLRLENGLTLPGHVVAHAEGLLRLGFDHMDEETQKSFWDFHDRQRLAVAD